MIANFLFLSLIFLLVLYLAYQTGHHEKLHRREQLTTEAFKHGFEAGRKKGRQEGETQGRARGFEDGCRYARTQQYNERVLETYGLKLPNDKDKSKNK